MSVRTRLAFVVILILFGCVFAAPYYRNQVASLAKVDPSSSLPTLQIQRPNIGQQALEVMDVTANTISSLPVESTSKDRFRSSKASELAPIPALKMPSPAVPPRQKALLNPISVPSSQDRVALPPPRKKLKPVSLIGEGIGAAATWGREYGSDRDNAGPPATQTLKPKRMQRFAERRMTDSRQRGGFDMSAMREITPRRVQPPQSTSTSPVSRISRQSTHRIVNGDTLEQLSTKYYGSPEHGLFIFEANRETLVSPAILPIGKDLIIPKQPEPVLGSSPSSTGASVNPRLKRLQVDPPRSTMGSGRGWRRAKADSDRQTGL